MELCWVQAASKLASGNGMSSALPCRKPTCSCWRVSVDRKSTRLNSSHTEIYTLSLHDALPIYGTMLGPGGVKAGLRERNVERAPMPKADLLLLAGERRSEEHTSELQSHRDLHSFPTRRSSDLWNYAGSRRRQSWPPGTECRARSHAESRPAPVGG